MKAGSSGWFLVMKLWSTSPFFIMWLLIFQKSHSLNHIYKNITELHAYGKKIGLVTYDLSLSIFSVPINSIILSFFFPALREIRKRKEKRENRNHTMIFWVDWTKAMSRNWVTSHYKRLSRAIMQPMKKLKSSSSVVKGESRYWTQWDFISEVEAQLQTAQVSDLVKYQICSTGSIRQAFIFWVTNITLTVQK